MTELKPSFGNALCLVSCEEAIENKALLLEGRPNPLAEKEHVLVCTKVIISGRVGVVLLDPGYHVARVVTVMQDGAYPHTGWFTQTNEPWVKREYRYYFPDDTVDYVIWEVKETRGSGVKVTQNLIYVARPFENAVEFTEKRNLVYKFRSWLARNIKGEIMAGLYFALNGNGSDVFTVTCSDSFGNKKRLKFHFSDFLQKKKFSSEELYVLKRCGQQLGTPNFQKTIITLANILADSNFISEVLDIDEEINLIAP